MKNLQTFDEFLNEGNSAKLKKFVMYSAGQGKVYQNKKNPEDITVVLGSGYSDSVANNVLSLAKDAGIQPTVAGSSSVEKDYRNFQRIWSW